MIFKLSQIVRYLLSRQTTLILPSSPAEADDADGPSGRRSRAAPCRGWRRAPPASASALADGTRTAGLAPGGGRATAPSPRWPQPGPVAACTRAARPACPCSRCSPPRVRVRELGGGTFHGPMTIDRQDY